MFFPILLIIAIITGQVVKIPIGIQAGPIILDLVIILFCLIGLYRIKLKFNHPPIFVVGGLCFLLVGLTSLLLTPLNINTYEYIISLSYTIRFSAYLLFGWFTYNGNLPEIKNNTGYILIYSGVGLAVLGILQLIFIPDIEFLSPQGWDPHYFRTVSTFLDPNFVGTYFALTLLILANTESPKKMHHLFFIITYLAMITTFSRGAFLAFSSMFIITALLKRSFKFFLISSILILGFMLIFLVYQERVAKPRNIDREQSAQYRLNTWQQGIYISQHYPILGVGFNSYRYALREFNLANNTFINSRGATSNDSSLLFVIATTGIIGLISYLTFLGTLGLLAFKNFFMNNTWGNIMLSALSGLLIQSFFSNNFFYPFFLIWIFITASKLNTILKKTK